MRTRLEIVEIILWFFIILFSYDFNSIFLFF